MLMKNCTATPTTAAHRNTSPAWEAMYGNRMYSPLATPTPTRMTLGPISRRSGGGSGSSRSSAGSAAEAPPGRDLGLWHLRLLHLSPPSVTGVATARCAAIRIG